MSLFTVDFMNPIQRATTATDRLTTCFTILGQHDLLLHWYIYEYLPSRMIVFLR